MQEIWRDVVGYEGYYRVSNLGNIFSIRSNRNLTSTDDDIYGHQKVFLYVSGKRKTMFVHRLVAIAFLPNPNNYPAINHKDENPRNNSLDNLEWCTYKYNNNYGNHGKRISMSKTGMKYNKNNYGKEEENKRAAQASAN